MLGPRVVEQHPEVHTPCDGGHHRRLQHRTSAGVGKGAGFTPGLCAMKVLEEIERRMDELARQYVETHDKEIIEELYELARELEKMEKLEKQ